VFELLGDYNNDGISDPPANVDSADYVTWQSQNGQSGNLWADGDDDGDVDGDDYDLWAANFGNTLTLSGVS
jgi:hypothetical protein